MQFSLKKLQDYSQKSVEIVLMADDVESYYEKVKDIANVFAPLKTCPWGLKDFRYDDRAGYYLRLTDRHHLSHLV